jgi:hypothetical protein
MHNNKSAFIKGVIWSYSPLFCVFVTRESGHIFDPRGFQTCKLDNNMIIYSIIDKSISKCNLQFSVCWMPRVQIKTFHFSLHFKIFKNYFKIPNLYEQKPKDNMPNIECLVMWPNSL